MIKSFGLKKALHCVAGLNKRGIRFVFGLYFKKSK